MSQSQNFECLTPEPTSETISSTTSSGYCDISGYTGDEYVEDISIIWVDVNFHFVGDGTSEVFHCDENGPSELYAPNIAQSIINEANNNFESPCLNNIVQSDLVTDARIRYRIFEADGDPCTGIYFYDSNVSSNAYPNGNQTLNIEFRNFNSTSPCTIRGVGPSFIEIYDLLAATKLGCASGLWNYANTVNHEFGHVLGLSHSFSCSNQCDGIDMDETLECNNPSPNVNCGFGACLQFVWTSGSNNFMGYNGGNCAITPCQWGVMMNTLVNGNKGYVNLCEDDSQGPRIIVSGTNEVWNDHVYLLNRDVIVETGATLTINCEVRMGEDKRIIVQRGAKLVVDGGKISNLCDDTFWKGIVVHGNESQEQPNLYDILQPDDSGVVYIRGSRIENAVIAVRAAGKGVFGYPNQVARWGGLIVAENSHFINNKVAAGFMKYDFPNKSRFINCTFEQLPDLDYDRSYGVSIWACHDILFEGNTFKNLKRAGIEGVGFSAKIITGNSFVNLFPAIWIRSSSSQPGVNPIEIGGGQSGNTFESCPVGIYATATNQLNNLIVKNNAFLGGNIGLYIDGPSTFTVDRNEFGGEEDKGMDQGIVTIDAGRQYNYASCNNFENVCIPIESEGNNSNFSFLGNEFINASSSVRVRGTNAIPGVVRYEQGIVDDTPNNCFGSGVDIETVGITELFKYYIPNNSSAPACLFPEVDGNNYFTQEGFSDFDICGEIESIPKPPYQVEGLVSARANVTAARNLLAVSPENQTGRRALNKWSEIKDVKLRWLIESRVRVNDFSGAESIAYGEAPTERKKLQFAIRLAGKNYESAMNALLTIPTNTQEEADFVTTQSILLKSLSSSTVFELTNGQRSILNEIKEGTTSSRGAADALLWRYDQKNYDDNLAGIYGNFDCGAKASKKEETTNEVNNQSYSIFPNPVSSMLTVEYPTDIKVDGEIYIRLYSIHGQELLNTEINGNGRQQVDLSGVSEGVYFLTIQNKDALFYQDKLIVIK